MFTFDKLIVDSLFKFIIWIKLQITLKNLTEAKAELLKNEKLRVSREAYVQKLKEIFTDKVIELNDGIESKMSSTGTGTSEVISQSIDTSSKANIAKRNTPKDNKIIFLNNEVIQNNLNEIDEANNELLLDTNDDVIELKDEITDNEKIIQLSEKFRWNFIVRWNNRKPTNWFRWWNLMNKKIFLLRKFSNKSQWI